MNFFVDQIVEEDGHEYAILSCACDLEDQADPLVTALISDVRIAYGEPDILKLAEPDPSVAKTFDTTKIIEAVRRGFPNPAYENNKPPTLTNYRSETTELVARRALCFHYKIEFPVYPQSTKTNSNQPVLGFDGWGFLELPESGHALVLVQVKGTDQRKSPPDEARKLAQECRNVPEQLDAICRTLTLILQRLKNTSLVAVVMQMLQNMGEGNPIPLIVAPVIVRGSVTSQITDLEPVRLAFKSLSPVLSRGVSVSIGVDLNDFGREVMLRARAA